MNITVEERKFLLTDGHDLFQNCHASTITPLPHGDLLVAFFAGLREGEGDTAIWLVRSHAGRWLVPRRLFAEDGLAHWNPVLHAEGDKVWIFYKVGPTVHQWTTQVAFSEDGGKHWTVPSPLVAGETAPRGPVKNKLIVLSNGDWLAPGSVETATHWDAFADRSSDKGRSWQRFDVPLFHRAGRSGASPETWQGLQADALWETDLDRVFRWDGVIQPTLWESAPGRVHMLLRSTRGQVYRSDSADFGRTWSPAYATALPNNNSGLDLAKTAASALVLAFNPIADNWGRRSPLSLAASTDNGATWSTPLHLETADGEFSYPAIVAAGGDLHMTYTWNRKNIVYRKAHIA